MILGDAIQNGSKRKTLHECSKKRYAYDDINYGLWCACEVCNLELINLMIGMGADDWVSGYCYACFGRDINIVKMTVEKSKRRNLLDLDLGLRYACWSGNIEIVNYMISIGANNWNSGLSEACRGKTQLNYNNNKSINEMSKELVIKLNDSYEKSLN